MKLCFFCPRWGNEQLSWALFMDKVKAAGYDGIEWAVTGDTTASEIDEVLSRAQKRGLSLIVQHYDTRSSDFSLHFDTYAAWLEKVRPYPWRKINSQTGRDIFSFEQNCQLIGLAGEGVVHETHRGKFSFAAHVTKPYLEHLPELRLTLDISHWINVAESFLQDQAEAMELAISRAAHVHARVGYPQGPQVPDPRVKEWEEALNYHLNWWDGVVSSKQNEARGTDLTITSEFGPYPYMVHDPNTRRTLADQWTVNLYMMNLLKKRYA